MPKRNVNDTLLKLTTLEVWPDARGNCHFLLHWLARGSSFAPGSWESSASGDIRVNLLYELRRASRLVFDSRRIIMTSRIPKCRPRGLMASARICSTGSRDRHATLDTTRLRENLQLGTVRTRCRTAGVGPVIVNPDESWSQGDQPACDLIQEQSNAVLPTASFRHCRQYIDHIEHCSMSCTATGPLTTSRAA